MNVFFLLFSAILAAGMMCIFLAYVAVPAIIFGSLWILYKNWKQQFFPNGIRSSVMPHINQNRFDKQKEDKIIDVDFHEVK